MCLVLFYTSELLSLSDPRVITSVFSPSHSLSVHLQFIASPLTCLHPYLPFLQVCTRFSFGLGYVFGLWLALCFLTCLPWCLAIGAFLTKTQQLGLFEQDIKA